jgi:surfeit locus 1 family protein
MSLTAAAVCARLGLWQLHRLEERRARNREAETVLSRPPLLIPPARPGDVTSFRRVRVTGTFDFPREFVLGGRARGGSPGVHIATPVRLPGSDTVLIAVRGWVYSPDAASVDLQQWMEPSNTTFDGYALGFDADEGATNPAAPHARTVRRLTRRIAEGQAGAPVAPFFIMVTSAGSPPDSTVPARFTDPALNDGPHLSYAVQWFLFGTIFGAGGTFLAFRRPKASHQGVKRDSHT